MSKTSKEEYLESCRRRHSSRNRQGKSTMVDEVGDASGWDRKHPVKALNGKLALGKKQSGGDLELRGMIDDLCELARLPLHNHFTPVMKPVEKQRIGGKVSEETKRQLRAARAGLDPLNLAQDIEARLEGIFRPCRAPRGRP